MPRSAAPVTKSHPPTSPNTAPATQNELWTVTLLNCDCTELFLYWTVLYWTVPLLNCDCTELLLYCELLLYWTVTLLNCDPTELWLYWTVTLLNCYLTDLLLYWTVTWLNCDFTELLLDWTVTLLNCYFTDLLLYWTVTWLICYFTELLLDWSVTLLNCYFTDLLLYWTVTLLICYFTEFLAFLKVRNSEVSHPNFLWWHRYIYIYVYMSGGIFSPASIQDLKTSSCFSWLGRRIRISQETHGVDPIFIWTFWRLENQPPKIKAEHFDFFQRFSPWLWVWMGMTGQVRSISSVVTWESFREVIDVNGFGRVRK